MTRIAVFGATGYTGREALSILIDHPGFEVVHATSRIHAGKPVPAVHPALAGRTDLRLEAPSTLLAEDVDAVVSCLPHGQSMATVLELRQANPELRFVDLAADYRFPTPAAFRDAYQQSHEDPQGVAMSAYGLPELFRQEIRGAAIVGNPGCYPTAGLLALAPLAKAGLVQGVTIDAKSGLSGAGSTPSAATHFANANEGVAAYKVGGHRHQPELAHHATRLGAAGGLVFTPHLVPMDRGILATCYVRTSRPVDQDEVGSLFAASYDAEPFVRVRSPDDLPNTKHVAGTNFADVAPVVHETGDLVIVICAIDNLLKGASGQAVQNLNLLFGLPEPTGLGVKALEPQVPA